MNHPTSYGVDGSVVLSRAPESFPQPGAGELELLQSLAEKLGYELQRRHSRSNIRSAVVDVLMEFDSLLSVLSVPDYYAGSSQGRDRQHLEFNGSALSREEIALFFAEAPPFFAELKLRYDISASLELRFVDWDQKEASILMSWVDGQLLWVEEPLDQPSAL